MTNCCNNFGPYKFPEKLIPLLIARACAGESLPVYGDGQHVRDWLFVDDHVEALVRAALLGVPGKSYLVGARATKTNLEVAQSICALLDELRPRDDGRKHNERIVHVQDRSGHDRRYAIDPTSAERELGWSPRWTFDDGMRATVKWYLENSEWWSPIVVRQGATARLGLKSLS